MQSHFHLEQEKWLRRKEQRALAVNCPMGIWWYGCKIIAQFEIADQLEIPAEHMFAIREHRKEL